MVYANFDTLRALVYPDDSMPAGLTDQPDRHTTVKERTYEAYAKLDFKGELGGKALTGGLGVRVARLSATSSGFFSIDNGMTWTPVSIDNDYTDFLPSLNMVLHLSDQKLLRFGGDNSLATAGMNQYSTQYTGVPYKFFPSGHFSWMLGANANFSETFEITPSTASGGSSFTTPAIAFGVNGVTRYNGIATVANGLPSEYAVVDLTAQTALIGTTTLYTTPSAGQYRLSWNMKITTAAVTSSTLGPLTIVYTDPDSVAVTMTAAMLATRSDVAGTEIPMRSRTPSKNSLAFSATSSRSAVVIAASVAISAFRLSCATPAAGGRVLPAPGGRRLPDELWRRYREGSSPGGRHWSKNPQRRQARRHSSRAVRRVRPGA